MGKRLTLLVDKTTVYEEVSKLSGYTGAKDISEGASYDRIAIVPSQYELLDTFWNEGCTYVTDSFYTYVTASDNRNGQYMLQLMMTNNWLECVVTLNREIISALTDYIFSRWLKLLGNEKESVYSLECERHMTEIAKLINRRKRPSYGYFQDDDIAEGSVEIACTTPLYSSATALYIFSSYCAGIAKSMYFVSILCKEDDDDTEMKVHYGRSFSVPVEYSSDLINIGVAVFRNQEDAKDYADGKSVTPAAIKYLEYEQDEPNINPGTSRPRNLTD